MLAQKHFLLVATDYFSKWVKVETYATIKDTKVWNFVWRTIVCWFNIPSALVFGNDIQFNNRIFCQFCTDLNIKNFYSTSCLSQNNGQTESTNKNILDCLKKRLEKAKEKWVEELLGVLWANRTTQKSPTGESSFSIAFGMEAVIPTKIGLPIEHTTLVNADSHSASIELSLDLANKRWDEVTIQMPVYHQRVMAQYNKRVQSWKFHLRYLIL